MSFQKLARSVSAIEICVVIVILAVGLIPLLGSFSQGRKGVVRAEMQFVGEQVALEISDFLGVLEYNNAYLFAADIHSGADTALTQSLSRLKTGITRSVEVKEKILTDTIDGQQKDIKFSIFTISVSIPGMKPGETKEITITKLLWKPVD